VLTFLAALRESGTFEFHYKAVGEATTAATIGFEAYQDAIGVEWLRELPPNGWNLPMGLKCQHRP